MSQKLNAAIAVIGIDIGKNSFHIVAMGELIDGRWRRTTSDTTVTNGTVAHKPSVFRGLSLGSNSKRTQSLLELMTICDYYRGLATTSPSNEDATGMPKRSG